MRAEHLTADEIQAYAARRLSAPAALSVSDHLLECAECRAVVRQTEQLRVVAIEKNDLTYEELVAYLDDELDPLARREVSQKLARSSVARAELEDLAQFKREVGENIGGGELRRRSWPAWALPIAAALVAGVSFLLWSTFAQPREGALVLRDNGARLQITPGGALLGGVDLPAELRASLKDALSQNRMHVAPAIAALAGTSNNLAGVATPSEPLRAISPIATAVEDGAPTLIWTADHRATAYRVTVARANSDDVVATATLPAEQLRWHAEPPLAAGETYTWQVQAIRDNAVVATAPAPPLPEAKFQVLASAAREQLDQMKSRVGRSHLALALAYAHAGLIEKADAELTALERDNGDSALPAKLRAALRNGAQSASR